jgi:hypothetical protein
MLAVALVSLSGLLLELALTRLFSVVLFYHFAFFVISVALLGAGIRRSVCHIRQHDTYNRRFTTHNLILSEWQFINSYNCRMTRLPERTLRRALPTIVLAILAHASNAQAPVDRFKQVVQPYVDAQMFMGSVLVAKDGKAVFSKSYGMADLEWSVPNSPTTRFNIASMTKQFTAASILLLEDRGKLKTDDLVKKYLPDAPASWDKITIYHLLTHTSAIPDDAAKYEPGTPDKLVF